ncbi:MAG: LysM peptidoglycan-binding domain-containing protein [Spirochaetia bacterium]|nr:LysM peptidoglycan-binding domain-containing protein [Spirochaetia bacterium]
MKTIGIKLADGSFYPVLEEGKPVTKSLDLTTAHNNQTKVMVDLYRSENCTMDDAEYVDSLQIDNLVEHPIGEPSLSFTVAIDENNKLSAKMVDPETGLESDANITLVSRTLEERLHPDEYNISDTIDGAALSENSDSDDDTLTPEEFNSTDEPAFADATELSSEDFNSDDIEINVKEEDEPVMEETAVDEPNPDNILDETESTEESTDNSDNAKPAGGGLLRAALGLAEGAGIAEAINNNAAETSEEENTITEDSDSLADFSLPEEETPVSEDTLSADADSVLPDMDFDLPEENTSTSDVTISADSDPLADFNLPEEETPVSDDTLSADADSDLPDMDFDLPAPDSDSTSLDSILDDDLLADSSESNTTEEDSTLPDLNFDLPETENTESSLDDELFNSNSFDESPAAAGPISFTGLYDKETAFGESSDEETSKKVKIPVIICIICAIICVAATLLLLFLIPGKTKNKKNVQEIQPVIEEVQSESAPVEELPVAEEIPAAREEEIIVIEKAEEVVPVQPPAPVVKETPKTTSYKIKWGDTLWDISNTYYKNPWKYKYIARYNGIKDPDYIISGTYIIIPAE